jgi:hypothetical protein
VVGIVATLLTLGSIWIANYMPLVQGSSRSRTSRPDVKMVHVDAFDMRGTVFTVPTGRTATFRYRLPISNSGLVALRIDSIGTSDGSDGAGSLTRRAVEVIPDPWRSGGTVGYTSEGALAPLHPPSGPRGRRRHGGDVRRTMHGSRRQRLLVWGAVDLLDPGVPRHDTLEAGVEVRPTGDGSCESD